MAQLAQLTVTMDTIQAQLKTLSSAQTNQSRPKRNTTAGVVRETTLTGSKPDQKIKRYTKRKHTTRKGWMSVKRDVNDD